MSTLRFLIALLATLPHVLIGADSTAQFAGTWSAPSLSRPDTPIIISLLPEGKATEQVGNYHGVGTWQVLDGAVRITWESGWTNLLRPAPKGGFELLSWKAETSPSAPPDDIQPARRIDSPGR